VGRLESAIIPTGTQNEMDRLMKWRTAFFPLAFLSAAGAGPGPTTQPIDSKPATTQRSSTRASSVLEPVKEGTTQPAAVPTAQFPDGMLLSDLVGELVHEKNGQAVFEFEYGGKRLRMPVLPNSLLAQMEAAASSDPATRFRVTGRATAYRGHNHILIQDAVVVSDMP
jgi:hypothetical protein